MKLGKPEMIIDGKETMIFETEISALFNCKPVPALSCTISILPNQFHMLMHKQVFLEASCYTRIRQRNNYLSFE